MNRYEAPWTQDEVHSIDEYQQDEDLHPLTCPDCAGNQALSAYLDGLKCKSCNYTQNWVYPWMADYNWHHLYHGYGAHMLSKLTKKRSSHASYASSTMGMDSESRGQFNSFSDFDL